MALFSHASEFTEAAGYLSSKPRPALRARLFLYGHGIELVLKAFLRGAGMSLPDLKKIGHDLQRAVKEAQSRSLEDHCTLQQKHLDQIGNLNGYYAAKEFEYTESGYKPAYPDPSEVEQVAWHLLRSLVSFCNENRKIHDATPNT